MFSRRSLFAALGLALPLAAASAAEAATARTRTRTRRGTAKPTTAAKPRRQRRVETEATQPAKG